MDKIDRSFIGKRFGKLTVVDFDHVNKHRVSCWLCQCDCGNQIVVSRNHLRQGNVKSCGCLKHGPDKEDITGNRYGRLTVVCFDHDDIHRNSYWLCECECGNRTIVTRGGLTSGNTTSCGCYNKERVSEVTSTHGMSQTRLYKIWRGMRDRCENENSDVYHRYGGRGIEVCDEWKNFENFKEWTDNSGYSSELTIDRINNDDGYYPGNCRWADRYTQGNNRSSNHNVEYRGVTHTISEWSRLFNMPYSTLWLHINQGNMHDFEEYFDR